MSVYERGDWVRINDTIQLVTNVYYDETGIDMVETEDDYLSSESCEPWEPRDKEWCWFWDNDKSGNVSYIIGQFYLKNRYGNLAYESNNKSPEQLRAYSNCEPLIGHLPSFIN